VLKPMRGGTRKGAEIERGRPRRGKHQERIDRRRPGNTGLAGTDFASAAIPGVAAAVPRGHVAEQQEGQSASRGVRGYRGGETSEDENLGGIGMKQGREVRAEESVERLRKPEGAAQSGEVTPV